MREIIRSKNPELAAARVRASDRLVYSAALPALFVGLLVGEWRGAGIAAGLVLAAWGAGGLIAKVRS